MYRDHVLDSSCVISNDNERGYTYWNARRFSKIGGYPEKAWKAIEGVNVTCCNMHVILRWLKIRTVEFLFNCHNFQLSLGTSRKCFGFQFHFFTSGLIKYWRFWITLSEVGKTIILELEFDLTHGDVITFWKIKLKKNLKSGHTNWLI